MPDIYSHDFWVVTGLLVWLALCLSVSNLMPWNDY